MDDKMRQGPYRLSSASQDTRWGFTCTLMSEACVDVHTTLCYTSGRASFSFQFPLCSILFCPSANSVLFSYSSCPIISTLCPIFHIFRLSFFHILLFSCFHSLCFLRVLWMSHSLTTLHPCAPLFSHSNLLSQSLFSFYLFFLLSFVSAIYIRKPLQARPEFLY